MDNTRKLFDKLRKEVHSGQISCDDVIKRLTSAIEAEYLKETPNVDFINTCEDFLWEIGTQGLQPYVSSTTRYITAVDEACAHTKRRKASFTFFQRFISIAACFLLVILLTQGAIHFHWFTQSSDPEGELYIIQGHEITLDLIQSALATHDGQSEIKTHDWRELCEFLGFSPSVIRPEALQANHVEYKAYVAPGIIIIDMQYVDATNRSIAVLKIEHYLDPEEAYLMLQQDTHGEYITINGLSIYQHTNTGRNSYSWIADSTLTYLSGSFDHNTGVSIITELTKEYEK